MAFWIGGVRLPDAGFSLIAPSSGSSITIRPRAPGQWEIIPTGVFDAAGRPLILEPLRVDIHNEVDVRGSDAYLKLTPLPPGQTRSGSAPPTGPGDMLLEVKAYDRNRKPAFQIYRDRMISPEGGLEMQVFGPRMQG